MRLKFQVTQTVRVILKKCDRPVSGGLVLLIGLGGKDEVALREPIDFVSPDLDANLSPCKEEVRVVVLFLGDITHAIHESQRFDEILEREFLAQMMGVDHFPAVSKLLAESLKLVPRERRDPAAARHTFLACEFHVFSSLQSRRQSPYSITDIRYGD